MILYYGPTWSQFMFVWKKKITTLLNDGAEVSLKFSPVLILEKGHVADLKYRAILIRIYCEEFTLRRLHDYYQMQSLFSVATSPTYMYMPFFLQCKPNVLTSASDVVFLFTIIRFWIQHGFKMNPTAVKLIKKMTINVNIYVYKMVV